MKQERIKRCLVAAVVAFFIAFGGTGCLITGFRMDVEAAVLAFWYLCIFCIGAVCFHRGWGIWFLGIGALITGYLWHSSNLTAQLSALLSVLTTRYHNAYGIGVYGSPGEVGELVGLMGALTGLWITYAVSRRKGNTLSVCLGLLPLALCLVVTDTVPEEGYLYCLIFGMTMLILTGQTRAHDEAQGVRLSTMLALPLAAVLGLMFWLVPQEGYDQHPEEVRMWLMEKISEMPEVFGELSEQFAVELEGVSQSEDVDLTEIGPMRQYEYPVMEVEAPRSGVLYLRERDYDQYTGTGWVSTEDREETFAAREEWVGGEKITITTRWGRENYVLPYYPVEEVELVGGCAENKNKAKSYSFVQCWPGSLYSVKMMDMPAVYADGTRFDGEQLKYLGLPKTTQEGLTELMTQLLSNERTATEIAETVSDYVRASAEYDLNTGRMPQSEADFVLWFLNDSDTGYCVHFATTTAVLLRAAGVESRYVTGYMVTAKAGEPVTVTGADAHAWVEYYEPRLGAWLVLESTPAALGNVETEPTRPKPTQTTEPTQPSTPKETEPTQQQQEIRKKQPEMWILAAILGCAAVLWLLVRRWVILWHRKKAKKLPPNRYGLALWGQCEELAKALGEKPPKELESIAQKAKFSQHTLSEAELTALEAYVAESVAACREKPWYRRPADRYWRVLY